MTDELPRPVATWYGEGNARIFAVLHRPTTIAGRGVVLCNGVGFDGLLAHRTLRILATRLAAAGLAVVRFDYPGTGDSPGGDWEPDRVEAWSAGAAAAVAWLRSETGVDDVHLMGFRAGAIAAMRTAVADPAISGVSLWAPTIKGRAFARELQALARFRGATRPEQPLHAASFPDDSLEVVGFEFTAATLQSLREVELTDEVSGLHARQVLLLDRDDAPTAPEFVSSLHAAGATTTVQQFSGYLDFMTDDETRAVSPDRAVDVLVEWHAAASIPGTLAVPTRTSVIPELRLRRRNFERSVVGRADTEIVEHPHWFDDRLLGIVTIPAYRGPSAPRPTIVLANTGSVNRTGPGRLHVHLARSWAALGYQVVRFDLGGTGDSAASDPETENRPYATDRIKELRGVLDEVGAWPQVDSVIAMGVCSGAYNILRAAVDGAAVRAIVLMNPLIFSQVTHEDLADSADRAVLSANRIRVGLASRSWQDVRTRHGGLFGAGRRAVELARDGAVRGYVTLAKARIRRSAVRVHLVREREPLLLDELRGIRARGTEIVFAFASDEPGEMYLRSLCGERFERAIADGLFRLVTVPGGDHVFSPPAARERLVAELSTWLRLRHPVEDVSALRVGGRTS